MIGSKEMGVVEGVFRLLAIGIFALALPQDAGSREIIGGKVIEVFPRALMPAPYDMDAFDRCSVKHLKAGLDAGSRNRILQACKRAATAKKCRDLYGDEGFECVKACEEANIYSRKFGECSFSDSP